jgi:hypothetical protein
MDTNLKEAFLARWEKYFPGAELPISFYYTGDDNRAPYAGTDREQHCFIAELGKVRNGQSLSFDVASIPCTGGKRYLGFADTLRPNFRYFLSCGLAGEMEGERYKKTPEIVDKFMAEQPSFKAPGKYIVWKRVDKLEVFDQPLAVIFFAKPDALAGLFTLVNYDEYERDAVIAPMGSGCSSIVQTLVLQSTREKPKAVLGMFDVSARPYVPADVLTLGVVWPKFESMIRDMDQSFLITESWGKLKKRMGK